MGLSIKLLTHQWALNTYVAKILCSYGREHSVIGIYLALLSGIVQFAGVREDGRDRVRFDSALLESSRYRRVYVKQVHEEARRSVPWRLVTFVRQNKKMNGFQFRKFNIFHDGFRIASQDSWNEKKNMIEFLNETFNPTCVSQGQDPAAVHPQIWPRLGLPYLVPVRSPK